MIVQCVCVFFPSILDIKFVGRTSRGHTGGRSHRIFHPPSFCGACLDFCREKDSAIPFPRRPWSRILCTNELVVLHPLGIFFLFFFVFSEKIPFAGIELTSQRVRRLRGADWATGGMSVWPALSAEYRAYGSTGYGCQSCSRSAELVFFAVVPVIIVQYYIDSIFVSTKARTAEGRWIKNPVWPSSCVTPAGTSIDVQNGWEENTHTHSTLSEGQQ